MSYVRDPLIAAQPQRSPLRATRALARRLRMGDTAPDLTIPDLTLHLVTPLGADAPPPAATRPVSTAGASIPGRGDSWLQWGVIAGAAVVVVLLWQGQGRRR